MIPGFSNITRQADIHDGFDPEQQKIQVALVERRLIEENPRTSGDENEG